ncbi:hypothetical protein F4823DRAFT_601975 [Ustulina deusta]|nr:hypothetical protein F4823DRAFT_601975 [Ustulina deusta]
MYSRERLSAPSPKGGSVGGRSGKELYHMGLKHRGWELFLLSGPHIHAYQKCIHYKDSINVTKLVPICVPQSGEVQARIPFAIPMMISMIGRGRWDLKVINQALGTEVRNDDLDAWLEAILNVQLSIGGLQPEMTKPLLKRCRVDQTPGSGYWRALLDAAGLELHDSMTLAIDSDGYMPDEMMGTSMKEPPGPPSIHSQGSIDPGPRRGAAGDCEWDGLVDWI